jgi:outer membrane protein
MFIRTCALLCILATPALAQQDQAIAPQSEPVRSGETGIELGFRTGWGIPAGDALGGRDGSLSDVFTRIVPLVFELGYRIHPRVYIGAFYQYGVGYAHRFRGFSCSQPGFDCSVSMVRWGGDVRFHLRPGRRIDPWIATGMGWESMSHTLSRGDPSVPPGTIEVHSRASGLEYLHVDAGCSFRLFRGLSLGPFVALTVAHYSEESRHRPPSYLEQTGFSAKFDVPSNAIHEWIMFGLKISYLFRL